MFTAKERFSPEFRKVIGFALLVITMLRDWLIDLAPLGHPIRSEPYAFRRFASARVLIGSVKCFSPLWLARVITLVLASLENCSKQQIIASERGKN